MCVFNSSNCLLHIINCRKMSLFGCLYCKQVKLLVKCLLFDDITSKHTYCSVQYHHNKHTTFRTYKTILFYLGNTSIGRHHISALLCHSIIYVINNKHHSEQCKVLTTLGPELITVYRQSARTWLFKSSQVAITFRHRRHPSTSSKLYWQRHIGVNNLPKVVTQLCSGENWTHDLMIARSMPYPLRHCATV